MKTWTVDIKGAIFVVSADDVDIARALISNGSGVIVKNEQLIPLPTHHRYVRRLGYRHRNYWYRFLSWVQTLANNRMFNQQQ